MVNRQMTLSVARQAQGPSSRTIDISMAGERVCDSDSDAITNCGTKAEPFGTYSVTLQRELRVLEILYTVG
jgi:hypothetical protein